MKSLITNHSANRVESFVNNRVGPTPDSLWHLPEFTKERRPDPVGDRKWSRFGSCANTVGIILRRQQRATRQQPAFSHLLSGRGDDHRRHHFRRRGNYHVGLA